MNASVDIVPKCFHFGTIWYHFASIPIRFMSPLRSKNMTIVTSVLK